MRVGGMSDDLFDIFNDEAPLLAPAEVVLAAADAFAPSGSLIRPPTDSLTSTTRAMQRDDATDGSVSPLSPRSSAAPTLPTTARTPSSASPAPRAATGALGGSISPASLPLPLSRNEHGAASSPPHSSCATPLPLPTSTISGVLVIKATPSSCTASTSENRLRSPQEDGGIRAPREDAGSRLTSAPPPSTVITESLSRIRIRRPTVSLEQLSVRLAEFPFTSFDVLRGLSRRSDEAVARTCVGVVTRKSNPKQSPTATRSSRYAVLTLWSMEGISPAPETELSFLLCGSAFDLLYGRLVTGAVVALSNVARCSRQRSSPAAQDTGEVLMRVADGEAVRELGFAADLGRCASVSHMSNERCHAMVNTQRSQHCVYHVADLRKAARGGGNVGQDHSSTNGARGASASSLMHSATIKNNALTSRLTLCGSQQRLALSAPGAIAERSAVRSPALSSGRMPLGGFGVSSSGAAASLRMLRQTSFFAVRGVTGMPVEDATTRSGVNSAASGVYGGVQAGAPLALRQQVGLRPAASYPSAQTLGVTSRGRDVLEAARQKAVHHEEAELLRQPLRRKRGVGTGSDELPNHPRAVNGGSSSDVACGVPVRAKDGCAQGVTADGNVRSSLTARAAKRARTEVRPSSSLASVTDHLSSASSASLTAPATSASIAASTAPGYGADGCRVEALRQQFQPLHRGASVPFTPLKSRGAVHAVIVSPRQRDYRHSIVTPGTVSNGPGTFASQNALCRAAFKAARDVASSSAESTRSPPEISTGSTARSHEADDGAESALTLLGSLADRICSAHDHLRSEDDRQRLLSFVNKQITKEKALEALEAITEQKIKAHYCYACRSWYGQPPTTCAELHHRIELKPALKKYIKCEHCNYKTFVIGGDEAKGWKVYPRCPRCQQSSFWVRGDAALKVSAVVEVPSPS